MWNSAPNFAPDFDKIGKVSGNLNKLQQQVYFLISVSRVTTYVYLPALLNFDG